ncbi:MAG: methyl-accepting chemotaxis protein [Candidatus Muirbacterium halophilum]|nr:methyl-accepting chemotaxis protein [Candidatus Muirbacterium halophilum]
MKISDLLKGICIMIIIVSIVSITNIYFSLSSMEGDSRIVNYSGIVRGATQRLVKLELLNNKSDNLMDKIENIILGLINGSKELNLVKTNDFDFESKMLDIKNKYSELRKSLIYLRANKDIIDNINKQSEDFFELTNEAVSLAENYSKKKVISLKSIQTFIFIINLITVIILILISKYYITDPVRKIIKLLAQISKGDLSINIPISKFKGEMKEIAESADNFVKDTSESFISIKNMSRKTEEISKELIKANSVLVEVSKIQLDIINQINDTGINLNSKSKEINESIYRQSDSISSTTSSVEQLSASVEEISANTLNVSEIVNTASVEAENGFESMQASINAMKTIKENASQINSIISVITEIAEQTNLLALNAAIEAARAGEHGKGFSVVADEVRKLSERTADSAKEIEQLIVTTVNNVENNDKLATKSGEGLKNIVNQVEKAAQLTAEISAATSEQKEAHREIANAMASITMNSNEVNIVVKEEDLIIESMYSNIQRMKMSSVDSEKAIEKLDKIIEEIEITSEKLVNSVEKFITKE